MPTVLKQFGFRFFFYSHEGNEPIHIHVTKDDNYAKFWIKPIELNYSVGFKKNELKKIKEIVFSNQELFEEAWNEYFEAD